MSSGRAEVAGTGAPSPAPVPFLLVAVLDAVAMVEDRGGVWTRGGVMGQRRLLRGVLVGGGWRRDS